MGSGAAGTGPAGGPGVPRVPAVPPVPAHGGSNRDDPESQEGMETGRAAPDGCRRRRTTHGPVCRDPAPLVDVHAVDTKGQFFKTGDGILLDDANFNLYYIRGLLNSKRLFW